MHGFLLDDGPVGYAILGVLVVVGIWVNIVRYRRTGTTTPRPRNRKRDTRDDDPPS